MSDVEIFCVIMAGGSGERFWPKSRKNNPKQLLNLLGEASLIEQTVLRLREFVPNEKILIVTNRLYVEKIHSLCPDIPAENIIGEPFARDTAPCIALAGGIVKAKAATPDPVMIFLPADHFIVNQRAMICDFTEGVDAAVREKAIVTIGIQPSSPSPDYGYIECGNILSGYEKMFHVSRFLEKPSIEKAEELLSAGTYKWNAGIFLFSLSTLQRELSGNAPDLSELLNQISSAFRTPDFPEVLSSLFESVRKISFDYAVMEHADLILVKEASFDWDDVGNWTALRNYWKKDSGNNIASDSVSLLDCKDCIVYADGGEQLIAGIDLHDLVIVRTSDAVLIVPSSSTPKIKTLLKALSQEEKWKKYL